MYRDPLAGPIPLLTLPAQYRLASRDVTDQLLEHRSPRALHPARNTVLRVPPSRGRYGGRYGDRTFGFLHIRNALPSKIQTVSCLMNLEN